MGYETGERDINKAKCKIKVCCFKERGLETCADCPEYVSCMLIQAWHARKGYKYRKYGDSLRFIRENGYQRFMTIADGWKAPYGRLH